MKFKSHTNGKVSICLWAEKNMVVVQEEEKVIFVPTSLLQNVQDDMWAYDSTKHLKRKDEIK